MWVIITTYVILHNMIIKSEQEFLVFDTEPYVQMGPLVDVNHDVPPDFATFFAMRQEIAAAQASPTAPTTAAAQASPTAQTTVQARHSSSSAGRPEQQQPTSALLFPQLQHCSWTLRQPWPALDDSRRRPAPPENIATSQPPLHLGIGGGGDVLALSEGQERPNALLERDGGAQDWLREEERPASTAAWVGAGAAASGGQRGCYASPAARNTRRVERFCSTPTRRTRRVFLGDIGAQSVLDRSTKRPSRGFWWIKTGPGLDSTKPVKSRLPNKA
jgi:pyruvate/2-oxoglutarate dehydrogenase complex dihydrolipoamide acyltransferase (E2) component